MSELLMKGSPAGSVGYANGTGWMDCEHFLKYLDHFSKHANVIQDRKVLLIIDNHASLRNLEAVTKARSLNIIMVSLPPHTSHRMQPLDCGVYGPLNSQYARECDKWITNHPAKRISVYDIMEIFGKAFLSIAMLGKAVKGFEVTDTRQTYCEDSSESEDDINPECIYCVRKFMSSKSSEEWIQCQECGRWVHEKCGCVGRR
ncbi:hypothetical protein PPYR_02149 [Photinus pyralis]|uniref:DDE-1 domain-containing protein n=1 Tax=Photinus pyralis TaxID=7054 RepID=A0A5N4B6F7_PHOPY|nr:uncharacterized protein LOC116163947 [Photinus pyralis]KAB0805179.1 hypothetical protein PPYR_02149 [Photinus pyralis]